MEEDETVVVPDPEQRAERDPNGSGPGYPQTTAMPPGQRCTGAQDRSEQAGDDLHQHGPKPPRDVRNKSWPFSHGRAAPGSVTSAVEAARPAGTDHRRHVRAERPAGGVLRVA